MTTRHAIHAARLEPDDDPVTDAVLILRTVRYQWVVSANDNHLPPFELRRGEALKLLASMPCDSIDAVITDPPYGIDFQSSRTTGTRRKPKIANDKRPFIWFAPEIARVLKTGGGALSHLAPEQHRTFVDLTNSQSLDVRNGPKRLKTDVRHQ